MHNYNFIFWQKQVYCLLLIVKTDKGLVGQGLVRAVSLLDINLVEQCVQTLFLPQIIKKEPTLPEALWQSLWLSKRNHLQSSYALYALAAIDIAVWDLQAQFLNKPLHQLFKAEKDFIVPYGNGGWLIDTKQEMYEEVKWYLDQGCCHFKMRVGCENDVERIKMTTPLIQIPFYFLIHL